MAYHESAHALVAASLPNTDPVHKVSIIPRGLAALGYTMHRPEGDRYLVTQSELESRIQVLLAGTVAEEIIFGDVSTGRPERPGAGHRHRPQHGHGLRHEPAGAGGVSGEPPHRCSWTSQEELHGDRAHSEQTAREIDEEIRRIVAQSLERVRHVLETRRQALTAIADCLIEQETIDNGDLKRIIEAELAQPDDRSRDGGRPRGRRPRRPLPPGPRRRGGVAQGAAAAGNIPFLDSRKKARAEAQRRGGGRNARANRPIVWTSATP